MVNRCFSCGKTIEKGTNPVVLAFKGVRYYSHLRCIDERLIMFNLETFRQLENNGAKL